MKRLIVGTTFHLCLFSTKDIDVGDQLLYDYGDEANLWWRKKVNILFLQFSCSITGTGDIMFFRSTGPIAMGGHRSVGLFVLPPNFT